ncbi:hypothetical protein WSM22_33810 [Cytophagales bacterium WSM2-2]|nr:hypothetical protein WSM22_33810 [Cytophagales bacterium WSM2-2]
MKRIFLGGGIAVLCASCFFNTVPQVQKGSKAPYEQINFVELMRKYIDKSNNGQRTIEGIYSVSASITKKSKGLFSSVEKEKTLEQKEHYAQVAIIRDNSKNNREYVEIPIDKTNQSSYPIRGEFTTLSEGNILVLHHFEPKGKTLTYTFTYDQDKEMLEGIRTETSGGATITHKLVFMKLYPKPLSSREN